jgi:hypothetical protein
MLYIMPCRNTPVASYKVWANKYLQLKGKKCVLSYIHDYTGYGKGRNSSVGTVIGCDRNSIPVTGSIISLL